MVLMKHDHDFEGDLRRLYGLSKITIHSLLLFSLPWLLSLPTLRNKIQSFTICLDLKLVGKLGVVRFFFLR